MDFDRLVGCCGASELRHISANRTEIKSSLAKIAAGVRERNGHRAGGTHLVIATLNQTQTNAAEALEDCGFDCIRQWTNGITGREVMLYAKEIKISKGS